MWLGALLLAAACSALVIYPEESLEVESWTSVLIALSLPYVAGLLMAGLTELRWDLFALPGLARIKLRRFKRSLTEVMKKPAEAGFFTLSLTGRLAQAVVEVALTSPRCCGRSRCMNLRLLLDSPAPTRRRVSRIHRLR